jgi:hypothetical protein
MMVSIYKQMNNMEVFFQEFSQDKKISNFSINGVFAISSRENKNFWVRKQVRQGREERQ